MKITLRLLLILLPLLNHAQQRTFEDYRKMADNCLKQEDYKCAIQNYERALRIRENDTYCNIRLQKAKQMLKVSSKSNATASPSSGSSPLNAYLLIQTDLPIYITINKGTGGTPIPIFPNDIPAKLPLNKGVNTVEVKPVDGINDTFERTFNVTQSGNQLLKLNLLANRKANQQTDKEQQGQQPKVSEAATITEDTFAIEIALDMVLIKGGTFQMGSNDEKPIHSVTLNDFYICKYEVTQQQWRTIMGSNPPKLANEGCNNCPVEQVSWEDVQEYIKKLNQRTGSNYRLPTEAEWEYAARGGTKSKNYAYSGTNSVEDVGWFQKNSDRKTHPVGKKKSNELGLYDMTGNVWEWCQDWFSKSYYSESPASNPVNLTEGEYRVIRGGAADTKSDAARVTDRDAYKPSNKGDFVGFRIVQD
jgi:formylglycine-generating enzyme required for sulfatase activity